MGFFGKPGSGCGGAFAGGVLAGLCPCVIVMVPLLIGFIGGMGEMTTKRSFLFTLVFVSRIQPGTGASLHSRVGRGAFPSVAVHDLPCGSDLCPFGPALHGSGKNPHWQNQFQAPQAHGSIGRSRSGVYVRLYFYAVHRTDTTPPGERHSGHEPRGRRHNDTVYGLGQCLLILLVGTFAGAARQMMTSQRFNTANLVFKKVGGVLLILVGIYIGADSLFPGVVAF